MAESDACLFGSFHLNENVSLGMKSHDFTQIFSVALILLLRMKQKCQFVWRVAYILFCKKVGKQNKIDDIVSKASSDVKVDEG